LLAVLLGAGKALAVGQLANYHHRCLCMNNEVTFKPILWRLIIWKILPFYIGCAIGISINYLSKGYSNFTYLETAIILLIVGTILSIIFRKKFDIVISKSEISGQGAGLIMGRESFPISDIDLPCLHTQTLYEKISLFHTIGSRNGPKILVEDFIYGKSTIEKLYRTLEEENR
jgi:hypothetical protein